MLFELVPFPPNSLLCCRQPGLLWSRSPAMTSVNIIQFKRISRHTSHRSTSFLKHPDTKFFFWGGGGVGDWSLCRIANSCFTSTVGLESCFLRLELARSCNVSTCIPPFGHFLSIQLAVCSCWRMGYRVYLYGIGTFLQNVWKSQGFKWESANPFHSLLDLSSRIHEFIFSCYHGLTNFSSPRNASTTSFSKTDECSSPRNYINLVSSYSFSRCVQAINS